MQTVLQELKDNIQKSEILSNDSKIIVSAFIFNLLEKEKEQIESAYTNGRMSAQIKSDVYAEQYYSQTFKND